MDIGRNNLGKSDSLYLRQHGTNPIHWQEWGKDIVEEAARLKRPIFASVGYSSCHWCHVMAREAFSDRATANFLNEHFICVKVDREERPDIDHYLMEFLAQSTGSGGWPLNAFLTWDLIPIHALTYAPDRPKWDMPPLLDVARSVNSFLGSGNEAPAFSPGAGHGPVAEKRHIPHVIARHFDQEHGGWGKASKFPPHSTLLYMLYHLDPWPDESMESMARKTLDAIMLGGLNDHLQGGIFRYCVDREWQIPHFEKMLYDQAMALWVYSLAHKVLGGPDYRTMAMKIVECLESQFLRGRMYLNSLDADTNHVEGATYMWELEEIENALGRDGMERFSRAYKLPKEGNFDGRIHMTRKSAEPVPELEKTLLDVRKRRPQPNADEKFISGNNCLAVCALTQASAHLGMSELLERAEKVMGEVMGKFWNGEGLARVISNGRAKPSSFLFDTAAAMLAMTMLAEHEASWNGQVESMERHLAAFRHGNGWLESVEMDFHRVPAAWHDQPTPSGISMAEMALARWGLRSGKSPEPLRFGAPHARDFHNIAALLTQGDCPMLIPKSAP